MLLKYVKMWQYYQIMNTQSSIESRFFFIVGKILAFTLSLYLVRQGKNLPPIFKQTALLIVILRY